MSWGWGIIENLERLEEFLVQRDCYISRTVIITNTWCMFVELYQILFAGRGELVLP